jgi:hypothetical protein
MMAAAVQGNRCLRQALHGRLEEAWGRIKHLSGLALQLTRIGQQRLAVKAVEGQLNGKRSQAAAASGTKRTWQGCR